MGDEHIDTVPATESDEEIKSSVEILVSIPNQFEDFSESNDDFTSIDEDSFSIDDIDYVEASPPDSELVSLEVVEIVIPKVGGIDTDILLTIKDDILREKLSDFYHEEFVGELAHIISPPEYDHFYFKIKPELGNFTMDVVEDIFDNPTRKPRVHVPNVFTTHPPFHLIRFPSIFTDSRIRLVVSFPSGTRNKIFDPGIFIRVQSKIFLSRDAFSISFIRDPLFPVIDTLLPFSSENEDKVVNTGILAAGEEQSPHLSSHRGLKALNESPMMIHGENTPNLGVRHLHFYPP
ncbi:hypothetical protein Tco_0596215 [Tanacetum coccineum]